MHPAWASVAAALTLVISGCAAGSGSPTLLMGTVARGGIEVAVTGVVLQDDPLPYREGPPGTHCAVYTLEVRSLDGARHELRPSDFESQGAVPADAVARCGSAQLEPTWIGSDPRVVRLTILEGTGAPAPLYWRPR